MLELSLQSLAIIMAVLALAVALGQSRQGLNHWSLCACLLLLALLEGFDLLSLWQLADHQFYKTAGLLVESLLPLCWIVYAVSLHRRQAFRAFPRFAQLLIGLSALLPLLVLHLRFQGVFYSPDFGDEKILFVEPAGFYLFLALTAYQVAVLYYLEQALVSTTPIVRRQFLYEILGGLLIIAVMVFYQSQALLHRTIDMNLAPARSLAVAVGAAMIGYSRFKREKGLNIQVSQHVAFHSAALLAVGLYLVLLGAIGEGLRYLGLHDRRQVYAVIGVAIGIFLLFLFSSEKNRRRLKVLLYKHFYRQKYDYRQEWLKFTTSISSANSLTALQEAILAAYCETFARTGAALYLHDPDGKCYQRVAALGMVIDFERIAAGAPLIGSMIDRDWVYSTDDQHTAELAEADELLLANGICLCIPLRFEASLEGFITLGAAVSPGETLIYEDYDLMRVLASQATSALLSVKLSSQLSSAQEMVAIGKVSTFIMHDLKNHVTNLSLILSNARDYIGDPEFQNEMLENLSGTLLKMKNLILRLQKIGDKGSLTLRVCDLLDIARRGTQLAGLPAGIVQGESVSVCVDREELEKVVINLLVNAIESGAPAETLFLEVGSGGLAYFKVIDKGCGMTDDFIQENLFKPFRSTKPKGFGIGLYQCRQIVQAHKGQIDVHSTVGEGATFTVWLPKAASEVIEQRM